MEITVEIGYEQLLSAIRKLPAAKIEQLRSVLDDRLIQEKTSEELPDFQTFLLQAPVMDDEQYSYYCSYSKRYS